MKKVIFILFQVILFQVSFAQMSEWNCEQKNKEVDIATFVKGFCYSVLDPKSSDCIYNHNYTSECLLEIMAGANRKNENDSIINQKVQKWWEKYKYDCRCHVMGFTLKNGNVLKTAAQNLFFGFFDAVIRIYKLDINFIDPIDGKTLLDFVKSEFDKKNQADPNHPSTKASKKLYNDLRKWGALHALEL